MSARKALLELASNELESMRCSTDPCKCHFPPACRRLIYGLPGNDKCVDCNEVHPTWATVSYGALVCLTCSGRHRGLGVKISFVKSVELDSWSYSEVLSMLEGGNQQLNGFFERHNLFKVDKYNTNAARFYRDNLSGHVTMVSELGKYEGREVTRQLTSKKQSTKKSRTNKTPEKFTKRKEAIENPVSR